MKHLTLVICASICFSLTPSLAQDVESLSLEEVTERLRQKSAVVDSWTADMAMTIYMMGMPMAYQGEVKNKGARSAMTLNANVMGQTMEMRSITDADGISWTIAETGGMLQVIKMDMSKMMEMSSEMLGAAPPSPGPGGFGNFADFESTLSQYEATFNMDVSGPTDVNGVSVYILEGNVMDETQDAMADNPMFDAAGMSMEKVVLHVGAEDGFVRRIAMINADDAPFMVQELTNVVLNAEIDDAEFEFTPPEGVQVMDMTAMMEANMDALESGNVESQFNTKFSPGDPAPEFEAKLVDGTPVKLSDFRGKVVLLDFWATWCMPCIAELPNLVEAYERHHGDNFEIVGISLDETADELKAFLADHPEIVWPQIYSEGAWNSPVALLYAVEAIPFTLLLDGDGVVQAVNLRGEALEEAVAELLSSSGD